MIPGTFAICWLLDALREAVIVREFPLVLLALDLLSGDPLSSEAVAVLSSLDLVPTLVSGVHHQLLVLAPQVLLSSVADLLCPLQLP